MTTTTTSQLTILTFTPVWQRPAVFEICLKGIKRLQQYKPDVFRIHPFFIVSEAEAARMCQKYGFDFLYYHNQPLGAKKNAGLDYALQMYGWDYMMEIGSDDIINNSYLDFVEPYLRAKTPQLCPHDVWFIDTITGKTAYWETDKVLGAGRMISRATIQKVYNKKYKLWDAELSRGMDTSSWRNILRHNIENTIIKTDAIYALDIKSSVNINPLTNFQASEISPRDLLANFPEGNDILKLIGLEVEEVRSRKPETSQKTKNPRTPYSKLQTLN